jgi:phosphohistidine phosphatase
LILYLLRHADAEAQHAEGDAARGLTVAGARAMRAAAPVWRRLEVEPDVVLSSPLVRALQTARLLREGVGGPPPTEDERLAPGATWERLADALGEHPGARSILVVGHEPDLSRIVAEATGAGSVRMRKGGMACIEFDGVPQPGSGELAWLLDPDLYADDGG